MEFTVGYVTLRILTHHSSFQQIIKFLFKIQEDLSSPWFMLPGGEGCPAAGGGDPGLSGHLRLLAGYLQPITL